MDSCLTFATHACRSSTPKAVRASSGVLKPDQLLRYTSRDEKGSGSAAEKIPSAVATEAALGGRSTSFHSFGWSGQTRIWNLGKSPSSEGPPAGASDMPRLNEIAPTQIFGRKIKLRKAGTSAHIADVRQQLNDNRHVAETVRDNVRVLEGR